MGLLPSLSGGFIKLNVVFPPLIAGIAYIIQMYCTSPQVEAFLKGLPVPVEKVPYVVAAAFPPLIFITGIVPAMILAAVSPDGYDNKSPRKTKAPEYLAERYPVTFWLQCAHNNTIECATMAAPAFWVASTLGLNSLLFAKLSSLLAIARLAYIPAYGLGVDALRTTFFALGFFVITLIGFAPIFPDTILPLLGQALPIKSK
mmetsp:Transcript_74059/g.123691  ORF Transcript_74059/g.123691 Transcript_74059/m.123691 type:complete len:202 (+) Transcript_74059:40-645(+)